MTPRLLGWHVRDVFRQARASGFLLATIILVAVAVGSCFTLTGDHERLRILGIVIGDHYEATDIRQFLFHVTVFVADIFGVIVTLIATAAFLPRFLEPSAASAVLCKAPSRGSILLGRFIGITLFVTLFSGILIIGTAIGVWGGTGVWVTAYLLAWPLLVVQFVAFASAGALIAVATRNAVAVMLGSIIFALISWGISFGRHFLTAIQIEEARPEFGRLVGWVYWILPKPVDFSLVLHDALGVPPAGLAGLGLRPVLEQGLYNPLLAVLTTLLVAVVLLGLAIYELEHQDY